jgi:DNA polymerase I-like protein with 3'-5' exonuclease and polymerase domains|tara:strand:- start:81 stop:1952 length:1872 start_codon:yes stop_codon:yes gene_type:complete
MGDKIMQKPLFTTPTEWVQPSSFPDLSKYDEIAIDLETKDPELKKMGPGMFREVGNIVGFAVAVENWSGYFPIRHEGGGNMDIRMVLNWIKEVLNTPATKIFHNAMYDVCWLKSEGLNINGKIVDTMIATSLIDENRMRYDLNSVAKQYTGLSKNESSLTEAAQAWGIDPKAEMYKLPAMYVGEYAEKDAEITLALWQELKKEINHQDLNSIFDLETNLFPCLVEMKAKGVRVDLDHAKTVEKNLIRTENNMLQSIKDEVGFIPDLWAARSIAKVFDHLKLDYPRTEKTKAPSFTKNFLKNHNNFIINLINNARQANKARTTFMESIFRYVHKGRIHADINQLRSEFGGTITGRFSMTHPNLQQIPKSGTDMGNQLRTIFVPEEGHTWGCFDYSQQEPRLVVHYACLTELPGSEEFKEKYKNDFSTDFHKIVSEMADIPRDKAKTINLGKFYGMGKNKLKGELGVPDEEASRIIRQYDSRVPFVKQLMNHASDRAEKRGQIRTLLGRLCHFHLWEPSQFGVHKPLSHEAALQEHGPGIKRAFTYKALNKLIQGSAADMIKKAMLDLYKEKITPLIQIHDELNISIKDKAESDKVIEIMENAVSLEVPNKVDYEKGKHWGEIEG